MVILLPATFHGWEVLRFHKKWTENDMAACAAYHEVKTEEFLKASVS
jgi:hypothetical protein